ncbi:hypothetical protein L208DRAFT_1412509 [Tricholoma matsutake]|nr:hypothetical protein L208DRAFT_1412509 [Tricholoma matsutake 945]
MYCPSVTLFLFLAVFLGANAQSYSATYLPSNAPNQTQQGQTGTNQCGTSVNQASNCQNVYVNSVEDWCIFGPPNPGAGSSIGNIERIAVAWCTKNGTGARLIPDGAIKGAHFIETPDFVQVTGVGDLTLINVPHGDGGGELDPHGADGNGNPIGGLVFSNAFGALEQLHEWTNFLSDTQFCIRACKPGRNAPTYCQHIYDVMGCDWNMPANYGSGAFENCKADSGEPMGVYGGSTFFQGQPATPAAHPAPSSSSCTTFSTIGNGFFISGTSVSTQTATPTVTPAASTPAATRGSGSSTSGGASSSSSLPRSTGSTSAANGFLATMAGWELFSAIVGFSIFLSMFGPLFVL